MKKLLTLVILAIVLSLTLVLPVSAAETPAPTAGEVEALILDSYELFRNLYCGNPKNESIDVILHLKDGMELESTAAVRTESPYYSYWLGKSKSLYTDDISEDMLFVLNNTVKYNDKFYVAVEARIDPSFSVVEGSGAYRSGDVTIPGFDGDLKITFDDVIGDETVAHFTYRKTYFDLDEEYDLRTSVKLKYENGKWQISGGDYIDLMKENSLGGVEEVRVASAPQTGFATVAYAAVAVVSAAAVVTLAKKRRG